jgi:predicted  nucleic acid-binding Zn-ribbon protein
MQEVLQQLSNLQYIDSRIDEIRQLRGDLPEEVLDIETDIKRHEARISHREEEKKNLIGEKKDLELGIETAKQKNEKYEEQQLTVRNNREYDALTKEIEAQKQYAENATKRIEEIEKRLVELEDELEVNQKKLGDIQKLYEEKKENLDKVIESTESEESKLLEKRDEMEEELDKRYVRSYNRLRNGLSNGIAVVAMEKGAALGMALPPQAQVEVRRKNKIIIDENSGRIVVDPSFFEESKKQLNV